jgi:glycosyltransferase involved in cell wall biosynthesis
MSSQPLISVVIPTYNRAQRVQVALASVLAQTYREIEVIIVDDGSTDDTREAIARAISRSNDGARRIRYFYQANQGPSLARNRGIAEARGKWIAFLDSDDDWLPEKLELQMRALQGLGGQCEACFTDARMVNDRGMDTTSFRAFNRKYKEPVGIDRGAVQSLAKSFCGFWISTLLARIEAVRKIAGFDPEIPCHEDHDFYFRLSLATPLAYINKPLVRTDRSASPSGSTSRPWDSWRVRLAATQLMFEKWKRLGAAVPLGVRKTIERNLRSVHSHWTNWYLAHEKYDEARESVARALQCGFTANLAVKWTITRVAPSLAHRLMLRKGSDDAVHSR